MRRRHFLQTTAAAIAASLGFRNAGAQMGFGMGGIMGGSSTLAPSIPSGLPLRPLDVLQNTSADPNRFSAALDAAPYLATFIPAQPTQVWGFNGGVPGPVIELVEGQHADIEFRNGLTLDSTIHWHGLVVPADQDGGPLDPVPPGTQRTYSFDVPLGSAGTYWYHPHAHGTTTLQVGQGLAAPLIVRSADDPLADLPEVTLMITSIALDANAQVVMPSSLVGMGSMMMGAAGQVLVNGLKAPVHTMSPGATERWRILNATADRYLRLSLDGHHVTVVGTDGGLLAKPLPGQSEWLLAPAQRVELVVTATAQPSARFALRDLGYAGGMASGSSRVLMTVKTSTDDPRPPVSMHETLRPIADPGPATFRQQLVLSMGGMGMMGPFLINGASFDMNRVDLRTVVGHVELWDLVNTTFMDHPIHIHGTQFQLVSRTVRGATIAAAYPAWLDTVNVPAGETVTIKVRQTMPGKRMVHCHILPHEDAGMMAVLDVLPA